MKSPGRYGVLIVSMLVTMSAFAGNAPGSLVMPRVGAPAVVAPGGVLRMVLNARHEQDQAVPTCTLTDVEDLAFSLKIVIDGPGDGGTLCHVDLPNDVNPGMCRLRLDEADVVENAVFVYQDPGAYYVFAHLSAPAVKDSADAFREALAAANETEARFIVVTGPLTQTGTVEELSAVQDAVRAATLPVFVAGDSTDNSAGIYENVFPARPIVWRFGDDGYLLIPTTDRPTIGVAWPEDGGRFDGAVAYWREALKPARWVVAAMPGYRPGAWFRLEQTLLADEPVAAIITARASKPDTPAIVRAIWGTSLIVGTPPMSQHPFRLIDVTAQGLRPRELDGDVVAPQRAEPQTNQE